MSTLRFTPEFKAEAVRQFTRVSKESPAIVSGFLLGSISMCPWRRNWPLATIL